MDVVQGELITAGSTDATQLIFTDIEGPEKRNFFPVVVSGTVKFGTSAAAVATNHGWAAGAVVPPFEAYNGGFYFDAASALDTFVITAASVK